MNERNENQERKERLNRAAAPCPEEYRTAYAFLLGEAHWDAIRGIQTAGEDEQEVTKWRTACYFQSTITTALINTPELDPELMAIVVDAVGDLMLDSERFAERLRMLSRLRKRPTPEDMDYAAAEVY